MELKTLYFYGNKLVKRHELCLKEMSTILRFFQTSELQVDPERIYFSHAETRQPVLVRSERIPKMAICFLYFDIQ